MFQVGPDIPANLKESQAPVNLGHRLITEDGKRPLPHADPEMKALLSQPGLHNTFNVFLFDLRCQERTAKTICCKGPDILLIKIQSLNN